MHSGDLYIHPTDEWRVHHLLLMQKGEFYIVILLARINARIQALLCKTENGKLKGEIKNMWRKW